MLELRALIAPWLLESIVTFHLEILPYPIIPAAAGVATISARKTLQWSGNLMDSAFPTANSPVQLRTVGVDLWEIH